jgi:catechol 2,3-dioxygenase-like lactoylglutathione lyase family enzyme
LVVKVEKISAITLEVSDMRRSVQFYRDVLGLSMLYGGEEASLSSFRTGEGDSAILNLELGRSVRDWGRIVFYVSDVDQTWAYLTDKGFKPERPRDVG